jgi:thiamine biosynthesis lipoprotein
MRGALGTLILAALLMGGWWYSASRHGEQDGDQNLVQFAGDTMGTTYTVKAIRVPEEVTVEALKTQVDQLLADINRQMSTYDPASELSRFNRRQTTEWVDASPELLTVLEAAMQVSRLSDGAFDVTVGPLVNLWGFGPQRGDDQVPPDAAVAEALARVGYERVHLRTSPGAIRKERADVYVDLSAIAKGYAVDRIADYLDSRGIVNYLVEIGGELRGRGQNPQSTAWRIAIERPSPGERAIQRIVELADRGIATSGDYRNFFQLDGKRYSHTIDPRTGRPVRHELASVTVLNDSAMEADAMATALLVMGPERGFRLAQQQELAALFIVIEKESLDSLGSFKEMATREFEQYLIN